MVIVRGLFGVTNEICIDRVGQTDRSDGRWIFKWTTKRKPEKLTDMKVYLVNKGHQEFDLMVEVLKRGWLWWFTVVSGICGLFRCRFIVITQVSLTNRWFIVGNFSGTFVFCFVLVIGGNCRRLVLSIG